MSTAVPFHNGSDADLQLKSPSTSSTTENRLDAASEILASSSDQERIDSDHNRDQHPHSDDSSVLSDPPSDISDLIVPAERGSADTRTHPATSTPDSSSASDAAEEDDHADESYVPGQARSRRSLRLGASSPSQPRTMPARTVNIIRAPVPNPLQPLSPAIIDSENPSLRIAAARGREHDDLLPDGSHMPGQAVAAIASTSERMRRVFESLRRCGAQITFRSSSPFENHQANTWTMAADHSTLTFTPMDVRVEHVSSINGSTDLGQLLREYNYRLREVEAMVLGHRDFVSARYLVEIVDRLELAVNIQLGQVFYPRGRF